MSWIADDTLAHLRAVADEPDLSGTRYRITDRVGRGGMGAVYRARDVELDREVALKVLAIPDGDGAIAARMLAEARILARLEHPGIVPVHDVGTLPDGRVFYVMKLVRGRRLDEHAATTTAEAIRLARRICDPLAFAHANGVIHRDLKPENVMVGAFGEVLVLDWGVAKVLGEASTAAAGGGRHGTAAGARVGTPGWMAPEQAAAPAAPVDARTDVFGVGALLLFLLTGAAPTGATPVGEATRPQVAEPTGSDPHPGSGRSADGPTAHDERVRAILRRHEPKLRRRLRAVVERALARDPVDRYESVEALAADLDRYVDGEAVAAYRDTFVERAAAFVSRYRTPIALVLSYIVMRVLLILIGGR